MTNLQKLKKLTILPITKGEQQIVENQQARGLNSMSYSSAIFLLRECLNDMEREIAMLRYQIAELKGQVEP